MEENEKDDKEDKSQRVDKPTDMLDMGRIIFKFTIQCILPRAGSTNHPNWIHKVIDDRSSYIILNMFLSHF